MIDEFEKWARGFPCSLIPRTDVTVLTFEHIYNKTSMPPGSRGKAHVFKSIAKLIFSAGMAAEKKKWHEQMNRNAELARKCAEAKRLINEGHLQRFAIEPKESFKPMSEKPKVTWRCLRTDPPREDTQAWLYNSDGKTIGDCTIKTRAGHCANAEGWRRDGYTHWMPYAVPEPPPMPSSFDEWIKSIGAHYDIIPEEPPCSNLAIMGYVQKPFIVKSAFMAGYNAAKKEVESE